MTNRNLFAAGYLRHLGLFLFVFVVAGEPGNADTTDGWLRDKVTNPVFSVPGQSTTEVEKAKVSTFLSSGEAAPKSPIPFKAAKATLANSPDESTAEIVSTVRGVVNGPESYPAWAKLFVFVANQFEYEHYYGCKKGAQLTLLERKGNDADLAALLVAMLRVTGYQARYGYGVVGLLTNGHPQGINMVDWLGVVPNRISSYNATRGFPITYADGPYRAMHRVWAEVWNGSGWIRLDPACKKRVRVPSVIDVPGISGYDRTTLKAAAGGVTTGTTAIHSINEAALGQYLNRCTSNLLANIEQNLHGTEPLSLLGGWRTEPFLDAAGGQFLFPGDLWDLTEPVQQWTTIPDWLFTKVSFEVRDPAAAGTPVIANTSFATALLQGARLSLTFTTNNASGRVQLWLDDTLLTEETTAPVGGSVKVKMTIDHPHTNVLGATLHDQSSERNYLRGANYIFTYSFNPSPELLRRRQEQLDAYRRAGLTDGSRQVVCETLNVIGLTWLHQTELFQRVLAGKFNCDAVYNHRFGRVSQESGFYIDVDMQYSGFFSLDGNSTLEDQAYHVCNYVDSALEHGVIEQLQGVTNQAVSTVKLLRLSNQTGGSDGTIYYANPATWGSVQSQLQGYSSGDLGKIQSTIAQGGEVLLPKRGNLVLNQWTGSGYITRITTNSIISVGMNISGNLNGGYASRMGNVSPRSVSALANANPVRVNTTPISVGTVYGKDPIDLASGDYYLSVTDLEVGHTVPRGFSFTRQYHGGRRWVNTAGLGYGWTHNWNVRATRRSAYEPALGVAGTPYDAAGVMVAALVLNDLESTSIDAQQWALASLVAHWLTDQLQDNALAISIGDRSLQFIRRADDVWQAAGGVTSTLSSNGGGWILKERHGNTYQFDSQQRLSQIEDLWGKTLTATYVADKIAAVTDTYGRTLGFSYTNGLLSGIGDSAGRSIQFSFDTNANLVAVTDPEGVADFFSYDQEHRITEVRNHDNGVIAINVHDASGRVIEQWSQGNTNRTWRYYYAPTFAVEENPGGGRTYSFFDNKKRVTSQRNAIGKIWQTQYDGQDRVIKTVTPLLRTTEKVHDRFHNVIRATDPDGFTTTNIFDAEQRASRTTDALGHFTAFEYNATHQPTRVTNSLNQVTVHTYNPSGTLAATTDPGIKVTAYNYNSRDELIDTTFPNGERETIVRNYFGDPVSQTDARTNTTVTTYNLRRQTVTVTEPGDATSTNTYDTSRRLASVTDFNGNLTRYAYSVTGKLLVITRPDGAQIIDTYDTRDWRVTSSNELGQATLFGYDAAGQLRQQIDALSRTNTFYYDADGRQTDTQNPLGNSTGQTYNKRGLVITARDPLGKFSTNSYDQAARRTSFVNRRGYTYKFSFDDVNRQVAIVTPGGRTNAQTWNSRGLLASVTQPSEKTTTIAYDPRGREQVRTDPVGAIAKSLDGNGNLLSVTESNSTITRTFDARNRVKTYSDGRGHTLAYGYDTNGNLTSLTYEAGKTVAYSYDNRDRLRSVTDWTGRLTLLSYDAVGRLLRIDRPNNTSRTFTWDAGGQLVKVVDRHLPTGEPVASLRMRYDVGGFLKQKLELPAWPNVGALLERNITLNADNQILLVNGTTVAHDSDGNMTSGPSPTGGETQAYSWNARNQLVGYSTNITYVCDAEGQRASLTESGQSTSFVNDPHSVLSRVLVRRRADGSRTFYVYGPVLLYEIEENSGAARYYHYDHFGSTIALSSDDGRVTGRANYSAYGLLVQQVGALNTPFLWQGAFGVQTDSNGLLYMRARYFHPYLGRFISEDPLGLSAGPNVYSYANGNPITANDPSGEFLETAWDIFNIGLDIYSLQSDLRSGSYGWAALDAVGLVFDTAAALIPFLPGGAGTGLKAARGAEYAVKFSEEAVDVAKAVPNPYGKLGGPAHQAKVAEVSAEVESRGLRAERELRVLTPDGSKSTRYIDVAGRDPMTGNLIETHQIGRQTKGGLPIARERRAMDDIESVIGKRPQFHSYK